MIEVRIATAWEQPHVRSIQELAFATLRAIYTPISETSATSAPPENWRIDAIASMEGMDTGVMGVYSEGALLRITCLGVLPKFRQRGVASKLLGFAEQVAIERECGALGLFTIRETGNVGVFQRLGFVVVDEQPANWCKSDRYEKLYEVEMRRPV